MTREPSELVLADAGEAADLAAFLGRLLHYDRGAAVRVQVAGPALAVFGRPPSFGVLAVRTVRLEDAFGADGLDRTVSAGELLEGLRESARALALPAPVTGPSWAGVLPPRTGWQELGGLPGTAELRAEVAVVISEFRRRTEELAPEQRTREELDRVGEEIWSRPLGGTGLPVRAAHAAYSLGFLRPDGEPPALLAAGPWRRLRTPYGSVVVRRPGAGPLSVTPADNT